MDMEKKQKRLKFVLATDDMYGILRT